MAEGSCPEERPYRSFARIYDELLGRTAFECWLENFGRLVRRHGVSFRTAADIACGTGLAAEFLAGVCERVYAVDGSAEMLEVARAERGRENIVYLLQRFTDLGLPERVDILTCNFDSLNYLLVDGLLVEALKRFADSLVDGGWAIFDMNTRRQLEATAGNPVLVHRLDGAFSVWESSWDVASLTGTVRMTNFLEDCAGRYVRGEEVHAERAYDTGFVAGVLAEAGFCHVEALDAKDLGAVVPDTRRVQFVARKGPAGAFVRPGRLGYPDGCPGAVSG